MLGYSKAIFLTYTQNFSVLMDTQLCYSVYTTHTKLYL